VVDEKKKGPSHYDTLGVPRTATEAEVKRAYRALALKFHPDRHTGSTEAEKQKAEAKFKDIGTAYSTLIDRQLRQQYDKVQRFS
jgi:DnaJ-class molecular chaperone